MTLSSAHTKHYLEDLHENIAVMYDHQVFPLTFSEIHLQAPPWSHWSSRHCPILEPPRKSEHLTHKSSNHGFWFIQLRSWSRLIISERVSEAWTFASVVGTRPHSKHSNFLDQPITFWSLSVHWPMHILRNFIKHCSRDRTTMMPDLQTSSTSINGQAIRYLSLSNPECLGRMYVIHPTTLFLAVMGDLSIL